MTKKKRIIIISIVIVLLITGVAAGLRIQGHIVHADPAVAVDPGPLVTVDGLELIDADLGTLLQLAHHGGANGAGCIADIDIAVGNITGAQNTVVGAGAAIASGVAGISGVTVVAANAVQLTSITALVASAITFLNIFIFLC